MSDEAELRVALGAGVDDGAANEVAAVAAVTAVAAVGLGMGVSVGACGNKVPYSPSESIQRRNSFFIVSLIIGCRQRPLWIQRFWAFRSN